jgi:tricorn protease
MHDPTRRGREVGPLLMQQPTLSRTHVVFVFAGDLWLVEREGGDAQRLTSHPGRESNPVFSPDGQWIAFTGEYDGNVDVYVLPATGGEPRRLTYHPGHDQACGWTPDGRQVLFTSARENTMGSSRYSRLFTIPLEGGFPSVLPLPIAEEGALSPDGRRLAYLPIRRMVTSPELAIRAGVHWKWKGYRGGMTTPVWIADLKDSHVEKIPRDNSNDFNPLWIGENVYFLSDRDGPITLFVYDTLTRKVRRVIENDGLDIRSAGAGPGAIVYEQFGSLHLLDLKSGTSQKLEVRVRGDFPEVRPQFKKVSGLIRAARLSPNGRHAIFEARGEVLTAAVDDGEICNLTNTSGVAEREPAWSPDGKRIAYFSDESGRYALHIRDSNGVGEVQKVPIEYPPIFFCEDAARCTVWSPDAGKIAFVDICLNLCCVDLGHGSSQSTPTVIQVDRDPSIPRLSLTPAWSPDSRWLAYTKQLKNRLRAVYVYDLGTGRRQALTDGASDAQFVAFDANGEYLYFTASIDVGPALNSAEMSSWNRLVTRRVYAFLLRNDVPSPLRPIADEEEADNLSPGAHPRRRRRRPLQQGVEGRRPRAHPLASIWRASSSGSCRCRSRRATTPVWPREDRGSSSCWRAASSLDQAPKGRHSTGSTWRPARRRSSWRASAALSSLTTASGCSTSRASAGPWRARINRPSRMRAH